MYLIHKIHGIVRVERQKNNKFICESDGIAIIANREDLTTIDFSISEKEICKIIDLQKCIKVTTWNKRYKSYIKLFKSTDVKDWAKLTGLIKSLDKDLSFGERKLLSQTKDKIDLYLSLQKTGEKQNDAI